MRILRRQKKTAVKPARGPRHASADAAATLSTFGGSLLSLESRIMFDGAAVATASTVTTEQIAQNQAEDFFSAGDGATADTAPTGELSAAADQALFDALAAYDSAAVRQEILFVSASVREYQQLLDGISPNVEVVVLDPARDGVEQMADMLANRTGIDAIHLIGDGTEAEMHLGASFLTQDSISTRYAEQFQQIGRSLSADADLLIYGCNFGHREVGQLAMNALANLTGADVAASTDRTGHVSEYADWQLEVTTGSIETSNVIRETTFSSDGIGVEPVPARVEIVFVDSSVEDYETLLADVNPNATMVLLDGTRDGIQQIAEYLENRQNVDAIHIVSHGSEGVLQLGTAALDADSMHEQYAALLAEIGSHLSEASDILVYGCEFGKGDVGQEAAMRLSSLTGADVSASEDLTGAAELGGDWKLELTIGQIETSVVFSDLVLSDYDYLLAPPAVDLNGGAAGTNVTTAFTEQTPVAIALAATLTDPEGNNLNRLRATLTARPDGDGVESLSLNAAASAAAAGAGLTVTYNAATGRLQISGVASTAVYQTILRGIQYDNTSDTPNTVNRTVNVVARDITNQSSAVRTATITVAGVNDAPVAGDDVAVTNEDTAVTTGNVLANDSDVDSVLTPASITAFDAVSANGGTVVNNGDGTFTYTPALNFTGLDTFTYTVSDGALSDTATVTITVNPVNDAPVAGDDVAVTNEDTAVTTGNVLANDSDVDSVLTPASITAFDAVSANGGTVVNNGDGTFTYTPALNFTGLDTFTYTVSDGALSDTATVTITVNPVNDAPVAGDDVAVTNEDTAVTTGNVLANDSDVDSVLTPASITAFDAVSANGGTVVNNGDGTFTYTPALNFTGLDTFTYTVSDGALSDTATVTITVNPVNDAPVAGDDVAVTNEDTAVTTGNVLANDSDVDSVLTPASITAFDAVSANGGTVVNNGDGTFTYTPALNFTGLDTFTYTVSDGALSDTATVTITVNPVNDAPVAGDDVAVTNEDTAVTTGNVLANDSDVDSVLTPASITAFDAVSANGGTVVNNGDGTFTYTPALNFTGLDTFTYTVSDGALSDTATVTITVNPVNDAPVAGDDVAVTNEDTAVTTGNVLANDSDVDSVLTPASITAFDAVSANGGTVVNNGDGTFTYTPALNFTGLDTFTYTVSDGALSDTATVTITVNPVNDAPVAGDDVAVTNEDTAVTTGNVLANDSDVDSVLTPASITAFDAVSANGGTVVNNGDGTFTYTPALNFTGLDTFTYTVSDGALSDTATVTITVNPVNDAPVAGDDVAVTNEDTAVTTGNVLANDSDVDSVLTPASITAFDAVSANGGTVVNNGDGTFTYTPALNFTGLDTFTYTVSDGALSDTATVTITVNPVNDAPVAGDDVAVTNEDTAVTTGNVLANDSDVDSVLTPASITAFDAVSANGGTVVNNGDGTFTYTPALNFTGLDTFTYTVSDGALSDTATVTITVNPVNDAPVAGDDVAVTNEDTAVTTGNVLANDSDVDSVLTPASITAFDAVSANGGTVVNNGDGTFTYTPALNFTGLDTFTYTVSDGALSDTATVTITVNPVNDAPVAGDDVAVTNEDTAVTTGNVLANDSDVDSVLTPASITAFDAVSANGGTVVNNGDGTFTYTPALNFTGLDTFTYTVSDGALSDTATVTITVNPVNDAPVAGDDVAVTNEDTAVTTGNVLANDSDVDSVLTPASITAFDAVSANGGTVVNNGDGTFTYTPALNFTGLDTFTYTVSDGALSDTATVTITVNPVNDAPVAGDDVAVTNEDTAVTTGNVLANDSDVDSVLTPASITAFDAVSANGGTVVNNGDGTFTYTPALNFTGLDTFTYTVSDGALSDTATVTITVNPVNDAPVAGDDVAVTNEDTAVTTGNVLANDSDVDSVLTPASITAFDAVSANGGTVVNNGDGTFTYTPALNFTGLDTFTYTVSDGALSDTATVTITVNPVNDAPVAGDDVAVTNEDTAVTTGNVLANDSDVDSVLTPASITAFDAVSANGGTVVNNGDGTFTYTPALNFTGLDTFTYTVSDGALSDTATVTITVNPVNDAPVAGDDVAVTNEDTAVTTGNVLANDSDVDSVLTPASITAFDAVSANGGTVVNNGDGTFTYTPALNFTGLDTFTYTVSDGALSDTATVTITVNPVNDAPVAGDDVAVTNEDTAVTTGNVLANDSDVDSVLTPASITAFDAVSANGGTVVNNGDGTFTYTPALNFTGLDTFTYTVSDGALSDTATVTITVNPVNDAPVAGDDVAVTNEDTAVTTGNVLANDSDVDSVLTPASITAFDAVSANGGTVVNNGDGTFTYTPALNFTGLDTFTYTVSDGALSDTATVTITVNPVNDAPVAGDDVAVTNEDTAVTTGNVLANDSDVDSVLTPASITAFDAVSANGGTVVNNGDGTFTYTPALNFTGLDTFTYTVSDGALSDTATVTITVNPVNDAPVAGDDVAVTNEDTAVTTGNVLANDSDVDSVLTPASITAFDAVSANGGTVVNNGDGTFTYTPALNFTGLDTFTYTVSDGALSDTATVTITVNPVNDAPVAGDDVAVTNEDTAVTTGNVLANDSDVDSVLTPASITAFDAVSANGGTVVNNGDGTFTYTPALNFTGLDTFTYTVSDGALSDTATVTITVNPVNDAPVAGDDVAVTNEDTAVTTGNVLANDSDVDSVLTPASITAFDAVSANGGTVVNNGDGTFTYTPALNFTGLDTFTYTVSDGALSDTATVTITVNPVNDAPVAGDDVAVTNEDTAVTTGNVLANDSDVDSVLTPASITAFDAVSANGGTVVNNGDGTFTYTPALNFTGLDTFTYTVSDGALSDTATVTITVNPVVANTVTPFFPPPLDWPPAGSDPAPMSSPKLSGPPPVGVGMPVLPHPEPIWSPGGQNSDAVLVNSVDIPDEAVPHKAIRNRTFTSVEQTDSVLQAPSDLPLEPSSLSVKKMLPVGHNLADRLTKVADKLERANEAREQQTGLVGLAESFTGIALVAGFAVWLLRRGSSLTGFLASLPMLGVGSRNRRKRDRETDK